jgi:hypothetical protein
VSEFGYLVERVEPLLGPVKRRVVFEKWVRDTDHQVVAIVPRFSRLTLLDMEKEVVLCRLRAHEPRRIRLS